MISVVLKKDIIEIKGHANQNPHGTDIVCASVSTSVIMTINLIDQFGLINDIDYEVKEGYTKIKIIKETENLNKILNNLVFTLNDLELSYSKYIKIKK